MPKHKQFQRVAVIGLGLMGGSLALAVKRRGLARVVVGCARRAITRRQALRRGAVDLACDRPADAVRGADLVVFCAPVSVIPGLVRQCLPHFAPNAVVTDVGSSKAQIVSRLEPLFRGRGAKFVGSHPITGSERNGLEAASPFLYDGALVVVARSAGVNPRALNIVTKFWRGLGARVSVVAPGEHDRWLARTSHLPHLVAAALAANVGRDRVATVKKFCGPGFSDATRIAAGLPEMWRDIVASNRRAVAGELRAFRGRVEKLERLIAAGDFDGLQQFLEQSRDRRRRLTQHG